MSQLGNALKSLRSKRTQQAVADACGLTTRTLQRAESGLGGVALATVLTLAGEYKVTRPELAGLLVAWLQLELGANFELLDVKPKGKTVRSTDDEQFLEVYRKVPSKLQRELRRAAEREEVLKSIGPLNDLYDRLKKEAP